MIILNKNNTIRKGLYFAAISFVAISTQCCYAGMMNVLQYNRHVAKQGWQAYASMRVKTVSGNTSEKSKGDEWFRQRKYAESIYKVMAQALADCQNIQAEFYEADQKVKQVNASKKNSVVIVEFSKTDPVNYDGPNWNAVILWNYLAEAIHGFYRTNLEGVACVASIGQIVKSFYEASDVKIDNLEEKIKDTVSDIQAYAKALDLYEYIFALKAVSKDDMKNRYASEVTCAHRFKCENFSGEYCIAQACVTIDGKNVVTPINVKVRWGNVIEYVTTQGRFARLDDEMNLAERMQEYYLSDFDNKLLSFIQVKNLTNFGKEPGEVYGEEKKNLSSSKCYFNAAMQALHASPTFRDTVKQLKSYNELYPVKSLNADQKILNWSIAPIV